MQDYTGEHVTAQNFLDVLLGHEVNHREMGLFQADSCSDNEASSWSAA